MKIEQGQVAVVTGGASGIGLALARSLGTRGVGVVVADIEQAALDAAVTDLGADGIDALGVVCDVTSPESVDALADEAYGWRGRVDLLANNAGVVVFGGAGETTLADWRWVIDVDLWGVIHGIHTFLPRMLASGTPGHIVNTASVAGLFGFPGIASYVAAKHAVVGLSQSLHHELATTQLGISVLCPGVVSTNINTSHRNRPGTDPASVEKQTFGGDHPEAMTPEQVAAIVVDAVGADRFWVLPHEHYAEQAVELARTLVDGTPPVTSRPG